MSVNKRILALFDVDGTLTPARERITPHMDAFMKELRKHVTVGVVGGSDLKKQMEQLGESGTYVWDYYCVWYEVVSARCKYLPAALRKTGSGPLCGHHFVTIPRLLICLCAASVIQDYVYSFSENGLVAYKNGRQIGEKVCIVSFYC